MAGIKFYEKKLTKGYMCMYNKDKGVFVDYIPYIRRYVTESYSEIELENPPTEQLPIIGSVIRPMNPYQYPNTMAMSVLDMYRYGWKYSDLKGQLSVTLKGERIAIAKIDYCIDEGGVQKVYLEKVVNDEDTESLKSAIGEYEKVMAEFMTQLIETDYRFKQYVKDKYDKKKLKELPDIIRTIADVMNIVVDIDELDEDDWEYCLLDLDTEDGLYLNGLYNAIKNLEIDDELKLFDKTVHQTSESPQGSNFYNWMGYNLLAMRGIPANIITNHADD